MIRFPCPMCKARLKVDIAMRGKKMQCPACKKVIDVPRGQELAHAVRRAQVEVEVAKPLPGTDQIALPEEMTSDELHAVRQIATHWAASIPHHRLKAFGSAIRITAALRVPVYWFELRTQTEKRTLRHGRRAWKKGERVAPSIPADTKLDVWSYPFKPATVTGEQEDSHVVNGSERILQCGDCQGKGGSTCSQCGGTRRVPCAACGGRGKIVTQKTEVRGVVMIGSIPVPKMRKVNTSTVCGTCHGRRKLACPTCGGRGAVRCESCEGSGRVVEYLEIMVHSAVREKSQFIGDSALLEDVSDAVGRDTDGAIVYDVARPRLSPDQFQHLPEIPLVLKVRDTVAAIEKGSNGSARVVGQRLRVWRSDAFQIRYAFQNHRYSMIVCGKSRRVHATHNPFANAVRKVCSSIIRQVDQGDIANGLTALAKCFEIGQADTDAGAVLAAIRWKLADAYVEAARTAGGQWSLAPRYFVERALVLVPAHPEARSLRKGTVNLTIGAVASVIFVATWLGILLGSVAAPFVGVGVGVVAMIVPLIILWWYLQKGKSPFRMRAMDGSAHINNIQAMLANDRALLLSEWSELESLAKYYSRARTAPTSDDTELAECLATAR